MKRQHQYTTGNIKFEVFLSNTIGKIELHWQPIFSRSNDMTYCWRYLEISRGKSRKKVDGKKRRKEEKKKRLGLKKWSRFLEIRKIISDHSDANETKKSSSSGWNMHANVKYRLVSRSAMTPIGHCEDCLIFAHAIFTLLGYFSLLFYKLSPSTFHNFQRYVWNKIQ